MNHIKYLDFNTLLWKQARKETTDQTVMPSMDVKTSLISSKCALLDLLSYYYDIL